MPLASSSLRLSLLTSAHRVSAATPAGLCSSMLTRSALSSLACSATTITALSSTGRCGCSTTSPSTVTQPPSM
ncbi:hypothetical protein G6F35_015578 [Rhizopus arrhizus]|nr:hypothetical protein G6F35_015578 [Rhizopus arrhizus]